MITVFILALPADRRCDGDYLWTVSERYVLHMDNAPHPPYSPDLAPPDFFLFGYLKEMARAIEFEAICDWIKEQFHEMLRSVFQTW